MNSNEAPITFERHGGVAGVVLRCTFDRGELSPPEAEAIARLQHRTPPGAPVTAPDRFEYHLRSPEAHVVIGEDELPEALRPLIRRLLERARRRS